MPRKNLQLSATLSPAAQEALDQRAGESGFYSRSGAVSRALERYAEVCRRHLPQLSREEWMLVCDALNGALIDPAGSVAWCWAEVSDACTLNGAAEKWGVDGAALVSRLQALDYAGLVAVVDVAERFWAAHSRGEDGDEALPWEK